MERALHDLTQMAGSARQLSATSSSASRGRRSGSWLLPGTPHHKKGPSQAMGLKRRASMRALLYLLHNHQ